MKESSQIEYTACDSIYGSSARHNCAVLLREAKSSGEKLKTRIL